MDLRKILLIPALFTGMSLSNCVPAQESPQVRPVKKTQNAIGVNTDKRIPERGGSPTWNQLIEQTIAATEGLLQAGKKIEQEFETNMSATAHLKLSLKADVTRSFPSDRILALDAGTDPGVGTLLQEMIAFDHGVQQMSGGGSVALRLTDPHGKTILQSRLQLTERDAERPTTPLDSPTAPPKVQAGGSIRPRPEPDANAVIQSAISLIENEINTGNPFDVVLHYHTNDGVNIHLEAKASAIPSRNQISISDQSDTPTTQQLRQSLENLVKAAKTVRGTGSVRIHIEKAGHLVSDRTGSFQQ